MFKFLINLFFFVSFYAFGNDFEFNSVENVSFAFKAFEEKGEMIWPRFHPEKIPSAIHFNNGHLYGFGWKTSSTKWKEKDIKGYSVLYCPAWDHPLLPLHASFSLENQKVFLISFDHRDFSLLTFIHELFHTYQFQHFQKIRGKIPPADFSVEQLALIELENRLLSYYLQSENPDVLRNYIAVNRERRMNMDPIFIIWEDLQQRMEGLADYVSLKTFAELNSCPDAKKMMLTMREQKKEGSLNEDALKGRHYFVGAALAFALDDMHASNWKGRTEQGTSLQILLEENLDPEPSGVEQAKKQFDWNEIIESATLCLNQENKAKNELLSSFYDQEGVVFHISVPKGPLSIGGRHEKSCQIDEDKTLLQKDISAIMSGDQLWKLTFDLIPFVIEDRQGNRTFKITLPLILTLDDQKMELQHLIKEDQVIFFNSLSFQNNVCALHSLKKGKIIVQEGALFFVID